MFARKPCLILLSSLACAVVANAQTSETSGAVRGFVKNRAGSALAEAKVTVRNLATGFTRVAQTDAKGSYLLPLIPVGDYEITVVHPKMQTGKNSRLRVILGDATVQNFTLDTVEAGATVVVTAQATTVDTQQVSTGTSVTTELAASVPLISRNFTDLAQLTPGAVVNSQGYRTAIDGGRGTQNNLMIDGAGFNSNFYGEQRGGTRIPFGFGLESIRELQVITNAYDAQYGNAAGGIINAVSKTGTNETTGMFATQLRPSSLEALEKPVPYDPSGTTNSQNNRQLHGSTKEYAANIGGPIIKDVLHYFVNVDYIHNSLQSTPADGQATTSNYAASDSPAQQQAAWNAAWGPGGVGQLITTNNGQTGLQESTTPWTDDEKHLTFLVRLDWTLNMENHASLRVNRQQYEGKNDTWSMTQETNHAWSNNSTLDFNSTSWVAELQSTFGGNFINDARFQLAQENRPTTPNSTVPALDLPGLNLGGYYIDPRNTREHTYQLVDTLTRVEGDWTYKGGIDWQWLHYQNTYYPDARGEISFSNWDSADWWMNGGSLAAPLNASVTPSITYYQDYSALNGTADFGEKLFATFFQASYTGLMDRRLTLSAGLRYTREMWDANPSANPALQGTDQMPDNGSFDPRFGFALDLFGDNRTVLRGGFGCFSNPNPAQNVASAMMNNGINLKAYKVTYSAFPSDFTNILGVGSLVQNNQLATLSASQVQSLPQTSITSSIIDPRAKEAQARRASLELEHDLGGGFVTKVKALYSKTYNLQYWINVNMVQSNPTTGQAIAGSFYNDGYVAGINSFTDRTGGHSSRAVVDGRSLDLSSFGDVYLSKYDGRGEYKSLSFELNRQSATGFALASNITLSSSRDTNSNENSTAGTATASPFDPSQPLLMARSDNDTPLRIVVAGKLPPIYGFYVAGTFKYSSGLPWSPIYNGGTSSDLNGDNLYNDYALGGRNSMRQPYNKNFDLAISRGIYLPRDCRLDISLQIFNLFNWANQTVGSNYNATYYAAVPNTPVYPAFGKITNFPNASIYPPRQAQFNVKFTF